MIKQINHQNFLLTPFNAIKAWELFNVENDSVVLLESSFLGSPIPDTSVAQEYVDYQGPTPVLNRDCDIALEQQDSDLAIYNEGITGSGLFNANTDARNSDGTYKRLVYAQTRLSFYNKFNNPTEMFGMEYIDFPLGKTIRSLSDAIRIFTIPQNIFGDHLVPGTIVLYDTSLDDNTTITDDGYQNLMAGNNLFSKVQEVRYFGNSIFIGNATYTCSMFVNPTTSIYSDSFSIGAGILFGSVTLYPPFADSSTINLGTNSGSITNVVIPLSANDSSSLNTNFYTGSVVSVVIAVSGSDSSSLNTNFYTGSVVSVVIAVSGSDSSSLNTNFYTGSITTVASSSVQSEIFNFINIGIISGSVM